MTDQVYTFEFVFTDKRKRDEIRAAMDGLRTNLHLPYGSIRIYEMAESLNVNMIVFADSWKLHMNPLAIE